MSTRPTPQNIKMYPDDAADRVDRFCSEMQLHDTIDAAYAAWDAHNRRLEEEREDRRRRSLMEG